MNKIMVRIHNVTSNQIIDREMNSDELAQYEADQADKAKRDTEQAAKAAARQAVLDKLGLSADEVAALLG